MNSIFIFLFSNNENLKPLGQRLFGVYRMLEQCNLPYYATCVTYL